LILTGVLTIVGCDAPGGKASHHHGKADAPASAENSANLRPDLFVAGPGTLEGCVGLYTYDSLNIATDSLDVDKGEKIFVRRHPFCLFKNP
jgi:hypothetical protein